MANIARAFARKYLLSVGILCADNVRKVPNSIRKFSDSKNSTTLGSLYNLRSVPYSLLYYSAKGDIDYFFKEFNKKVCIF